MLFLLFVVPAKKDLEHTIWQPFAGILSFLGGIAPQDAWNHRFSETKVNLSFCVGRKLVT